MRIMTIFLIMCLLIPASCIGERTLYDWVSPIALGNIRIARIGDCFGLIDSEGSKRTEFLYDWMTIKHDIIIGYKKIDLWLPTYDTSNAHQIMLFNQFGDKLYETPCDEDYDVCYFTDVYGNWYIQVVNPHTRTDLSYFQVIDDRLVEVKQMTTDHSFDYHLYSANREEDSIMLGTTESLSELGSYICKQTDICLRLYADEYSLIDSFYQGEIDYLLLYDSDLTPRFEECKKDIIAKDALVFFVPVSSEINNLTNKEIKFIYSKYKYDFDHTNIKVLPFQCNSSSDAQREFYKSFRIQTIPQQMSKSDSVSYSGMNSSDWNTVNVWEIEYVNFENALGFNLMHTYADKKTDEIKLISIDGIYPDDSSIIDSIYPLVKNILIISNRENSERLINLDTLSLEEISKLGFIPVLY